MSSISKITLKGRVAADPKNQGYEQQFVTFPLVVNLFEKDKDNEGNFINIANWYNCSANNPYMMGKIMKYLTKGMEVFVIGDFKIKSYTATDGTEKQSFNVKITDIDFMKTKLQETSNLEEDSVSNSVPEEQKQSRVGVQSPRIIDKVAKTEKVEIIEEDFDDEIPF